MRLWHKDLIKVLPRKQLVAQWRELCCIAKNIADNGTPNHALVNKVLDYSWIHFNTYTNLVIQEMQRRGYKISKNSYLNFCENSSKARDYFNNKPENVLIKNISDLYKDWHNDKYYMQCYYNLEEKHDCGVIEDDEFSKILDNVTKFIGGHSDEI